MQNLLLKIPYKFKKAYGGTPEPQTVQDAPWLHGPSLKSSYGRRIHGILPWPMAQPCEDDLEMATCGNRLEKVTAISFH